jgi:hypothetical protein
LFIFSFLFYSPGPNVTPPFANHAFLCAIQRGEFTIASHSSGVLYAGFGIAMVESVFRMDFFED